MAQNDSKRSNSPRVGSVSTFSSPVSGGITVDQKGEGHLQFAPCRAPEGTLPELGRLVVDDLFTVVKMYSFIF